MKSKNHSKTILVIALVLLAAATRLLPHPNNFTPILAIGIFSFVLLKETKYLKFILPVVGILYSDILLHFSTGYGFHDGTWLVYCAYFLVGLTIYFIATKKRLKSVLLASLSGSTLFYLITNFALFYPASVVNNPSLGQYRHDITGILSSYEAALPFYRNMLLGDLAYCGVLFGVYFIIQKAYQQDLKTT